MSVLHVEFKKSLMSPFFCLPPIACPQAHCQLSILRKGCIALSNLRVEGHISNSCRPPKIDRATQPFLKLDMATGAFLKRQGTGAFLKFDRATFGQRIIVTCDRDIPH